MPCKALRTLAIRKDSARWIAEPQQVYDFICESLKGRQLGLEQLFFLKEPEDSEVFLVGSFGTHIRGGSCLKYSCLLVTPKTWRHFSRIENQFVVMFVWPLMFRLHSLRLKNERRRAVTKNRPMKDDFRPLDGTVWGGFLGFMFLQTIRCCNWGLKFDTNQIYIDYWHHILFFHFFRHHIFGWAQEHADTNRVAELGCGVEETWWGHFRESSQKWSPVSNKTQNIQSIYGYRVLWLKGWCFNKDWKNQFQGMIKPATHFHRNKWRESRYRLLQMGFNDFSLVFAVHTFHLSLLCQTSILPAELHFAVPNQSPKFMKTTSNARPFTVLVRTVTGLEKSSWPNLWSRCSW